MRTIVSVVGSLLAALALPVLFVLVNGGLIYRTQCATPEGTVRTDWSYEWRSPIPYLLAPKETGCEVHSATHVLASKVGVAELDERSASEIVRGYAATEGADPDISYMSGVFAVITDLQEATGKQLSLRDNLTVMVEKGEELRRLAPPGYVAEDHARMVSAYDESVSLYRDTLDAMKADDQPRAQGLARDSVAATEEFARLAEQIRQAVVVHAAG